MKDLIKKILRESKFVSKNEMISKIIDEYDNKGKIVSLPDFNCIDPYIITYNDAGHPVKEICHYKDVSFQVLNCNFIMGVPHLIIKILSGKVKISNDIRDREYEDLRKIRYSIDYHNILKKAFQKWKFYGIEKLKVNNHVIDL